LSDLDQRRQRSVRSFVKRIGRMTPAQERALRELWPEFGVVFSEEQLDLHTVFGRTAPRVLEIGFGNGESLVEQASANPAVDYIGIEVHDPGVGHCLLHIEKAGISNVRLINHDAIEVMSSQIPDGALSRINLYFPDPWPKKRHHKRRLVQPAFLELAAQKIEAAGSFQLATDWHNYAEHIDALIESQERFRLTERRVHGGENPLDGNNPPNRPITKFERRGLKLGHKIWDWQLTRIS
jgi:tRNA (guanine-N7-)-methyltransferase